MIEVRLHGRGGQGAVTSAELVAIAAINQGKYAQAFPSFGPERRGAPVAAFVRVSDEKIRTREKVYTPDIILVLDPSLPAIIKVTEGLKEDGWAIVNSHKSPDEIRKMLDFGGRIAYVDATKIAMEVLGLPITNTTMLGALVKATGLVDLNYLEEALEHRFGRLAAKNKEALHRAMEETKVLE
ncbi:pyruvate ferredoxin oxidoreductase subunit gamma [Thermosulfuriphilus ammonigenes]|uniref:Pyruvate ferredoxin oxidoreductase subunit gamma n=1 Tax=Thermosulfuriphilus ammonigenes TaxID=1936021 RepID=A0A6G7PX70_9BACT|nr:pyruvate ferredoxin oxidoreductase subunit gamma [Thermosulfuriphilus ammonigenes]MBA2849614.1 pyruvate ferredoxin oxidoreductase gamma subunit [Thermosulfuriphilus ammonigenes]QIJ72284.1 pyruvate ferredoxin oxidoreductase subunit gamma [Thermosulfuriphilus ammonigenes]HFB83682.1 pyruvate ferredoxin oxidoreductase subunit gamma [Thermodesulfatator sp.]